MTPALPLERSSVPILPLPAIRSMPPSGAARMSWNADEISSSRLPLYPGSTRMLRRRLVAPSCVTSSPSIGSILASSFSCSNKASGCNASTSAAFNCRPSCSSSGVRAPSSSSISARRSSAAVRSFFFWTASFPFSSSSRSRRAALTVTFDFSVGNKVFWVRAAGVNRRYRYANVPVK